MKRSCHITLQNKEKKIKNKHIAPRPHTIRIENLSFLHFESLFTADKLTYEDLCRVIINPADPSRHQLGGELRDYLLPVAYNLELQQQICGVLYKYNQNFVRTSHAENIAFIQLIEAAKKLFPHIDSVLMVTSLISTFFIQALTINSRNNRIEDVLVWKPRYEIIFLTKTLLKQFVLQLELTTGVCVRLEKNTQTLIGVLLQTLINHGTLTSKTRHTAKDKTEVFVAVSTVGKHLSSQATLKLLKKPATTLYIRNTLYSQTQHYSSLQPVLRANTASRKKPRLTNLTFFHSRINMRLYINGRLLNKIMHLAERVFGLSLTQPESIAARLSELKISWGDIKAQRRYHELYRLYYLYLLTHHQADFNEGFYFCYYLDFRGRIYADSPISYTFNTITRWLYNYGVYTQAELVQFRNSIPNVSLLVTETILPATRLHEKYPKINYTDSITQYYIYIVFFELGKTRKNQATPLTKGRLTTLDIVQLGIKYFNEGPKLAADFEDAVEYLALVDVLEYLSEGVFVKLPVYKDATASALQLLLILLGPANERVLNEGNLKNTGFWYDTYYGIIERFWLKENVSEVLKTQFFTRAALKKTIMTHNYQATYLTCLNEFKAYNNLPGDNEAEVNKQVIPIFKAFYKYLNALFDSNDYFAISSNCIVDWFKHQWATTREVHFTTLDDLFIPLEYTKLTKQRVERLVLSKRETILWAQLTDDIDETKMFRAIRANIIHSFDGYLVRSVTIRLGYPIITIHDSFGIDILSIPRLISITQDELNKLVNFKTFAVTNDTRREFVVDSEYVLL